MDKQYWDKVLSDLDKKDNNSARRYRRYNKSLDAMGEKTVIKECTQLGTDYEYRAFEVLMDFIDTIGNEKLLSVLKALKPVELQIIICRFEYKIQVAEIAKELDFPSVKIGGKYRIIADELPGWLEKQSKKKK